MRVRVSRSAVLAASLLLLAPPAAARAGGVGGVFWSVYVPGEGTEGWARTQLEQLDLARRIVDRSPDVFALALTADDAERAFRAGKIASFLGMEGGHVLENSLGALRAYYALGARYMTLTHNVTLAWADSAFEEFNARAKALARGGDRTALFKEIFGPLKVPAATIGQVADHIEHVRKVAGVDQVGLGSDFDGNDNFPVGLEDVSKFPNLFAELIRRGWSDADLVKLAGGNVLRALRQAEAVAKRLQAERPPSTATLESLDGAGAKK